MNIIFSRRAARFACVLLFSALTVFGMVGCVDTYPAAPVYRGAYYPYDAYPYGYGGYPGYPYYGAPFGGGASLVISERSGYGYRGGYGDRRNRDYYRNRGYHSRNQSRRARQSAGNRNGARANAETVRPQ